MSAFRRRLAGPVEKEKQKFLTGNRSLSLPGTLRPLSEDDFKKILRSYPLFLGRYYAFRWEYLDCVIRMAVKYRPRTLLEVGASWLPLFQGSDVMDLNAEVPRLTYAHDARRCPWPVEDKKYDLLIALQVWEHLGQEQSRAFREVKRVARKAILSFPYKWNRPGDIHHMIDEDKIGEWTLHENPEEVVRAGSRIIYFFAFP